MSLNTFNEIYIMGGNKKYMFLINKDGYDFFRYIKIIEPSEMFIATTSGPFNRIPVRIQCLDGSYLKPDTIYRILCVHLDRVELETYYFPVDITDISQFESKRCEVNLDSFMMFIND